MAAAGDSSIEKNEHTKDHPLAQWFLKHSEVEDFNPLAAARQQVLLPLLLELIWTRVMFISVKSCFFQLNLRVNFMGIVTVMHYPFRLVLLP